MNRDLYKVRGQILDYFKKSDEQPTSNPEEKRKLSGEIDERIAEILADTRKYLSEQQK